MLLHKDKKFDQNWRKQILAFNLLSLLHSKNKKPKTALKSIY